ncbi:MAG: DUF935 family protein [Bdellovibrionaceae bacterium]|nr:DUF935 family protein [Pseudobdellovibrionaceae bacterium]
MLLENYGTKAEAPYFCPEFETGKDLKATAELIKAGVDAGLKVPARWAHKELNIPLPQKGEEVLERAAQPAPGNFPGAPASGPARPGVGQGNERQGNQNPDDSAAELEARAALKAAAARLSPEERFLIAVAEKRDPVVLLLERISEIKDDVAMVAAFQQFYREMPALTALITADVSRQQRALEVITSNALKQGLEGNQTIKLKSSAALRAYDPDQSRDEFGRWTDEGGYSVSVSADLKSVTYGKEGAMRTDPLRSEVGPMPDAIAKNWQAKGIDPNKYFSLRKNPSDYRDIGTTGPLRKGAEPLIRSALERRAEGKPKWTTQGKADFAQFSAENQGAQGRLLGTSMVGEVPGKGWFAGAESLGQSGIRRGYFKDKLESKSYATRAEAERAAYDHAKEIHEAHHQLNVATSTPSPGSMIRPPEAKKGAFKWLG